MRPKIAILNVLNEMEASAALDVLVSLEVLVSLDVLVALDVSTELVDITEEGKKVN